MSLGGSVVGAAFLVGWYLVIFDCLFSFFFKGSRKMTTIWDGEEGGSMCAVCFCLLRRCVHRHWRGRIEVGCESSCESCFSERDLKILVWRWRYFSDVSPNLAPPA